jgi:peptidoglycan/xylan/chitin deacetylase (PgdA/CDA1 family)
MFHSVGLENHPWKWSQISESIELFESKIRLLHRKGFRGVFWDDVYDHMAGKRVLPDDSILLTFDDGYLDNWVNVFPVLKRYGMKATIFVSPDFVDPSSAVRPNLDDVSAGRCNTDDLKVAGFLSWAEMRQMEESGLIDIQSHAMTHTWYFSGPKIVAFHEPKKVPPFPWMFWNARPERKPYYLNEDQQDFLQWGHPILQFEKSLAVRSFNPDHGSISQITDFVSSNGGREFFMNSNARSELDRFVSNSFLDGQLPGTYESDDARAARIWDEIHGSKARIEKNLMKQVNYICWPGGANDETVQAAAKQAGYKSWTLDSRSQLETRNKPGTDPTSIKRIGTTNTIEVRGRKLGVGGGRLQLARILAHQGSVFASAHVRIRQIAALLASKFKK